MKFKEKSITCDSSAVYETTQEYMEKWITSLLVRMKVDESKIHKILNDGSYSKRAWRTELFYNHGIEIIKYPNKVAIMKHSEKAGEVILGEWQDPVLVYNKKDKRKCEIRFNYWQIV